MDIKESKHTKDSVKFMMWKTIIRETLNVVITNVRLYYMVGQYIICVYLQTFLNGHYCIAYVKKISLMRGRVENLVQKNTIWYYEACQVMSGTDFIWPVRMCSYVVVGIM